MKDLLCFIAVLCVAGWTLGYFVFDAGASIHILLLLAAMAVLFGFRVKPSINRKLTRARAWANHKMFW